MHQYYFRGNHRAIPKKIQKSKNLEMFQSYLEIKIQRDSNLTLLSRLKLSIDIDKIFCVESTAEKKNNFRRRRLNSAWKKQGTRECNPVERRACNQVPHPVSYTPKTPADNEFHSLSRFRHFITEWIDSRARHEYTRGTKRQYHGTLKPSRPLVYRPFDANQNPREACHASVNYTLSR